MIAFFTFNALGFLKKLSFRQNLIPKIEGLEALTNLKDLDLYDNRFSKIEGLDTLTELT